MTATAIFPVHGGKPAPTLPEPGVANRYDNGYLRIKCHKLELAQITLGLIALALTQPDHLAGQTGFGYVFQFLALHLPLLTAAALWDGLSGRRLATVLQLGPWVWELYFNFGAATLYYAGSFAVLGTSIGHYNPRTNILAGVAGMLACLGHGYQWWVLFRENALRRAVEDEVREAVRNERVAGGVVNV
ncbi:hypothetical protein pipiens_006598 [Culex pipiens pipiens]|uniref:MARVEL domain-containing protein n=1 Tax=Culex pipiens pipiens TaxID=38569 RepID=A0ABD1DNV0_CULPP